MKLHAKMNPQEWKDLLNYLTARGALITSIPETDENSLFVDFKYAIVEYNDEFYSLHGSSNMFDPFEVTRYTKISPYEMRQNAYPREVCDTDELLAYMNEEHIQHNMKDVYTKWLFNDLRGMKDGHTHLWRLENELAGWREQDILGRLTSISMVMHTKDYCVLRFHSADGNHFDYETKSRRITG
jgi:hypothetical protein